MDLSHFRAGSGSPLLLLHGLGSAKEMWRPVVPLLAREREVIALDLPGFGGSPRGPKTVAGLAHCIAAFADFLNLDRPHFAGNSLGGGVALTLGAMGRARSVCAVSPIGFANDREAVYERGVLTVTRVLATALAPVAEPLANPAPLRAALTSHIAARPWRIPPDDAALWTRGLAEARSFWDLLGETLSWDVVPPECPTTIAWGDRDRLLIHSRQAPRARRVLPAARHVTLEGCGHIPTWDDPEQVARVILEAST